MFGKDEKEKQVANPFPEKEKYTDPDAPKPLRGEELDKALKVDSNKGVYMVRPKTIDSSKLVRFLTFYSANKDVVWLAICCASFCVLGYLVGSAKMGLSWTQIKQEIGTIIEIVVAIFTSLSAVVLKLSTPTGAIANSLIRKEQEFVARLMTRKQKIDQGEVNEWGVSIRHRDRK